jgi:hypothetical protein
MTKALLSAEHTYKCPQKEPWSDQVHFTSLHVKYWRLQHAATKNSYNATDTMHAINTALPTSNQVADTGVKTDHQELNGAKRNLATKRRDAKNLLQAFLQTLRERIDLRKTPKNLSTVDARKCFENPLRQNAQYGHIKSTLKPCTQSLLTKIHVTTSVPATSPDTGEVSQAKEVTVIDTKEELESHIMVRNK